MAKRDLKRRIRRVPGWVWVTLLALSTIGGAGWLAMGCGWDPSQPFMRNAPAVDSALDRMDAGDYESAEKLLSEYLETGPCSEDGGIGLSEKVRKRPDGSFDLGLTLFHLGEKYGQRFGDEEVPDETGELPEIDARRTAEIDCALIVAQAIAADLDQPIDLRARAWYLAGNLEFLRRSYEDAVENYDKALALVPGIPDDAGGDGVGRDAAWNRAIALWRLEKKDAEPPDAGDQGQDGGEPDAGEPDGGQPDAGEPDAGQPQDQQPDGGQPDGGEPDGGQPQDQQPDAGNDEPQDAGAQPDKMAPPPESSEPPRDRMLDDLREAPTYQEEDAKRHQGRRRGSAMEDK